MAAGLAAKVALLGATVGTENAAASASALQGSTDQALEKLRGEIERQQAAMNAHAETVSERMRANETAITGNVAEVLERAAALEAAMATQRQRLADAGVAASDLIRTGTHRSWRQPQPDVGRSRRQGPGSQ